MCFLFTRCAINSPIIINVRAHSFYYPCVCICVSVSTRTSVFVLARRWILLQYFPIIPAATAIDLAVDGDVSSVKLSVPVAWSTAPMIHSSGAACVSSLTSGVTTGALLRAVRRPFT